MSDDTLQHALKRLAKGEDLPLAEAADVMRHLVEGTFTPAQFGALMVALRAKGETGDEIAGFLSVLRARSVPVPLSESTVESAVDLCGTGGDGPSSQVFNISTTATFLVAAAGVPVLKHGTSAVSSLSGSSDVLGALGIGIQVDPGRVQTALDKVGACYLHAPSFNQGMRNLIGLRREVGLRSVFNLLGPLCNPAAVRRQITGIYDGGQALATAEALAKLGSHRAWVLHADDGLDEMSTTAATTVTEVRDGEIVQFRVDARDLGLARATTEELRGGTPAENAELLRAVLDGRAPRAAREIVLLNAAAALVVAGRSGTLSEGLEVAEEQITSGAATDLLHRWQDFAEVSVA